MQFQKIGKTDLTVSRVAFGAWEIGGGTAWECDGSAAGPIVDALPDMGINFIDTAKVYGTGRSEFLLGKALKGKRDKYILSSKGGMNWRDGTGERFCYDRDGQSVYQNTSAIALRLDLEESLERLDTDYLDIYFTHRQPITVPIEETMGALMQFKKEGKIRAIGISNASIPQLKEYMRYGTVDVVQEKFSLFDRGAVLDYIRFCHDHQITFQAYSVLERGIITDRFNKDTTTLPGQGAHNMLWYSQDRREDVLSLLAELKEIASDYRLSVSALAISYALCWDDCINTICGARSAEHIAQSAIGADVPVQKEDMDRIFSLVSALHTKYGSSTHQY